MSVVEFVKCDAEGGCGSYWRLHKEGPPSSWQAVTRRTVDGAAEFHLCARHAAQNARVDGQVGGYTEEL